MKQLIERSYKAIRERGLITDETSGAQFIAKAYEELNEWKEAYYTSGLSLDKSAEECTDLMTVCCMWLVNSGYDPIEEFRKVVEKNEERAKKLHR